METLFWIEDVLEKGRNWFSGHGRNGRTGLRTFSVSGTCSETRRQDCRSRHHDHQLINEYYGGMAEGHTFKGYLRVVHPEEFYLQKKTIFLWISEPWKNTVA